MGMKSPESASTPPRLVVGVGASAGGLDAFERLLAGLPEDTGCAFLLVQHLDPDHDSRTPELLRAHTQMDVVAAEDGQTLVANRVYCSPPGQLLGVAEGRVRVLERERGARVFRPVDHLFRTLGRSFGTRSVGVVLSGSGIDGSEGLAEIQAQGGCLVVQSPETCAHPEMPRAAIQTGTVDLVLPLEAIPAALARWAGRESPRSSHERDAWTRVSAEEGLTEAQMSRVAQLLESKLDSDLYVYKPRTVDRRVRRRVTLSGQPSLDDYLEQLESDPAEQDALVRDLFINVTEYFRDAEAFDVLRKDVILPLAASAPPGSALRAWVPACSSGEEAYSIAMEMLDAAAGRDEGHEVQVFATDIDAEVIAFARVGIYPASIAERIPAERLTRYFDTLEDGRYRVCASLRDAVSFAVHDLTKDPPFSRMHLVSCRNLLIYLTTEAQREVLERLHFSLLADGMLVLSTSESVGPHPELFIPFRKPQRIYRKAVLSRPLALSRSRAGSLRRAPEREAVNSTVSPSREVPVRVDPSRQAVLDAWVPPTVVVLGDGTISFMHGELGPYLRFPGGEAPRFELEPMLRPELAAAARGALFACRREGRAATASSPGDEGQSRVRIVAKPAPELGLEAAVLSFERVELEAAVAGPADPSSVVVDVDGAIEALEKELKTTRADLRSTVEESLSVNEELQAANEELEATSEELRSLNEELTTVNAQLREKVELLEQARDDLHNFIVSTEIATLFLDEELRVERLTPAAESLLDLDRDDVGRTAGDIARELLQSGLGEEAREVLEGGPPTTQTLRTEDERWVVRTMLPYRTESGVTEGVVVTFADVTQLTQINARLEAKNRRLELAWETAHGGIFEHRVPMDGSTYHSEQWARLLGLTREDLPPPRERKAWFRSLVHPDDAARYLEEYESFDGGGRDRFQLEYRVRHADGRWIWVRAVAKALERDEEGNVRHLLGMMIDISDLKRVEIALRESELRFREMTNSLPLLVWVYDTEAQVVQINETHERYCGLSLEELRAQGWASLIHPEDLPRFRGALEDCMAEGRPFHAEARIRRADGSWRWVESWGRPRLETDGEASLGYILTSADITERRGTAQALRERETWLRDLADNIAQLAWMADGEGNIYWYNRRWYEYTGTTLQDVQGWGWSRVHHPEHVDRVVARISRCFREGIPWEDTFSLRSASGEFRWFLSRALPARDESGNVVRWFGTNTDVTEQREVEAALEEANRYKDEFLAMLGHELRNPLAAILSATELMKVVGLSDPRIVRAQAVLERQTAHMGKLLDGLLDVSRIIRGKIVLERSPVDLVEVCREVSSDLFSRKVSTPELRLELPSEPVMVQGDRVRLAQIVDNVVSNAVKYTDTAGTITMELKVEADWANLTVTDTGVGIDAELLPHVFDLFRQSEQSIDRSAGGLGLGLALVRSLVELHGGEVEAHSDGLGKGASFVVRVPRGTTTIELEPSEPRLLMSAGLRVLVIEDGPDVAETLRTLLELEGHHASVAGDAEQGLSMARNEAFDVVLCDIGLPGGMSGLDFARAVRAADPSLRGLPLAALSGYGRAEDRSASEEAGFDLHLTKPLSRERLRETLTRLAGRSPS